MVADAGGTLLSMLKNKVSSPFGWPVPGEVRCVDASQLRALIEEATVRRYSRRARGVEVGEVDTKYIITPILPESTPEDTLICTVLDSRISADRYHELTVESNTLEVSVRRFSKLKKLSRREKNQLLHNLIWSLKTAGGRGGLR